MDEKKVSLYRVEIESAVLHGVYYVVAESFDAAAKLACERDAYLPESRNGGVTRIDLAATAGGPDAGFGMTDVAAESLGYF